MGPRFYVAREALTRGSCRHSRPAGRRFLNRGRHGVILLEVLMAATLVAVGVLGLAKLQARTAIAQMESYQRTQALLLARDMADRLIANKRNAADYVGSQYGSGLLSGCNSGSAAARDACEWDSALRGVSERVGQVAVGTLRGGRGCIAAVDAQRYQIVVAWQGFVQTRAPATDCARNHYGPDVLRRAVVVPLHLPDLNAS